MTSPQPLGHRITAGYLLAAPALLFGYGVVRLLDPTHSPGPVWTVSHLFYLGGFLALGTAAVATFRLLRDHAQVVRGVGRLLVVLGWLGMLCGIGQALIDLLAGANAADKARRAAQATQLRETIPGADQLFYGVGPSLSNLAVIGLLALAAALTPRRVPWWSPLLALAAVQLPSLTLDLIPVAARATGVALWPAYRELTVIGRRQVPVVAGASDRSAAPDTPARHAD